ncbi:N utilization substance protein B [Fructilactobacillus lindneri]|nr:N utilization substance protein B [Fructilactobacillus lindneri]ANZ59848.1 N utilization substance protein B [Fructilactobacillus lindneri]
MERTVRINRHQIRELAFQTLFAMDSNENVDPEAFFDYLTEGKIEAVPGYYIELVNGVRNHESEINQKIQDNLDNKWSLKRLNKSDLVILQMAVYEIDFVDQVPAKVAINEALEMTKKYSDNKSTNFINAVLDKIMK